MSAALGLDHVGIAVPDLDAASAEWEALGFRLTALARHGSARPGGGIAPTGTGNRCIMFRQGYLELIAVIDPARRSPTLEAMLARHAGAHVVTLAVADEEAALARLTRAGFATDLARSARPADPLEPEGPQARFARLPLSEAAPRLQLLRQLTPELVWQERFLHHPNHAAALEEIVIAADPPASLAARLSRAAGLPVWPDPAGGFALLLPQGRVRVLPPEALGAVLPGVAIPDLPFVAGVVLRTDDGAAALRQIHAPARPAPGGWLAMASGTAVLFRD